MHQLISGPGGRWCCAAERSWPWTTPGVEATVEYLRSTLGDEAWIKGMHPDVPETKILDNPYTYTEYRSGTTHGH